MGNLRNIKKNIKLICGDIASECLVAGTFNANADEKKLSDAICQAARLQTDTIRKVSVQFDKTPKDFENKRAYRAARRKYFKQAYSALDSLFFKEVDGILAKMNQAVPAQK